MSIARPTRRELEAHAKVHLANKLQVKLTAAEKKLNQGKRISYGKTPTGQLLFDLCFIALTDKWIARKHGLPVAKVRALRARLEIKQLAAKVQRDKA